MGLPAARGIDGAEASDLPQLDRAQRDLVGGIPEAVVAHRGHAPARGERPARVAQHAVDAPVVVGVFPWAVLVEELDAVEEVSACELGRSGEEGAAVAKIAPGQCHEVLR